MSYYTIAKAFSKNNVPDGIDQLIQLLHEDSDQKPIIVNFLVGLAQDLNIKFPLAIRKVLHSKPKYLHIVSSTLFSLDYSPATISFFAKAIHDRYNCPIYVSPDFKIYAIRVLIPESDLFEYIVQYLPDPKIVNVCVGY